MLYFQQRLRFKDGFLKNLFSPLFFIALFLTSSQCFISQAEPIAQTAPYPASSLILDLIWDWPQIQEAPGSDLWPTTWGSDGRIYTSWGDGGGFGGTNLDGRVSLGFARIEGQPQNYTGYNVWGGKDPENPNAILFDGKTAGMLSVNGTLYAWLNTQNDTITSPPDYKLAWSDDLGATWQRSSWVFPKSGDFFPSTFLNFGRDYAGARDDYVYSYGAGWTETQGAENHVYLMRVHKNNIQNRNAYVFFKGLDSNSSPTWTSDVSQREPVFTDPNGVGNTGQAAVVYNSGLGRYILTVGHRPPTGNLVSGTVGRLGVFDAPNPWGPWTTVAYYDNWGGFGDGGETLGYHIPTKWISSDGKTIWVIFSAPTSGLDSFNLVKGTLILRDLPFKQYTPIIAK